MAQLKTHVAKVERYGESLIVPSGMKLSAAIQVLDRQMKYEEEYVEIIEDVDAFPWDGALAFVKALRAKFGWVTAEAEQDWFSSSPPKFIGIALADGSTVQVPLGNMSVPGVEGMLSTGYTQSADGMVIFRMTASVKRKHEDQIREIAAETRRIVARESIYKGQAIKVSFRDEDGDLMPLPTPVFMQLAGLNENDLILPRQTEMQVRTSIWTPIEKTDAVRKAGIPLKRGVLLAGPYGTGKTLAASLTAEKAVKNGWTFLYIATPAELPEAVKFAKRYSPCVIFSEDVDRITNGSRDANMDTVLNTMDGVDSKKAELMVVLTTNHVDQIHAAMLRPGRIDALIEIDVPDADAAERLIRRYAQGMVSESEDLTEPSNLLAGNIPAVIREVVERAKLAQISIDGDYTHLTAQALSLAASGMKKQVELLAPRPEDRRTDLEKLGNAIGQFIPAGVNAAKKNGVDLNAIAPLPAPLD